jgi:pimeloyl-ACP methyl ester carboxylesterase
MMLDDGFVNGGEINPGSEIEPRMQGILGYSGAPVTMRSSFYYIIDYSVGSYVFKIRKSERIENYALRLKELIDIVKFKTGAEKIDIVAHSMGGLVVLEYASLFGDDNINKIILINSPYGGISKSISKYCSFLSASKECNDMEEGSIFIKRLNSKDMPDNLFAIRSIGCKMGDTTGDGIVTNESAYIKGAENYAIEGRCTDALNTNLHTQVLDPALYPETYGLIRDILKE